MAQSSDAPGTEAVARIARPSPVARSIACRPPISPTAKAKRVIESRPTINPPGQHPAGSGQRADSSDQRPCLGSPQPEDPGLQQVVAGQASPPRTVLPGPTPIRRRGARRPPWRRLRRRVRGPEGGPTKPMRIICVARWPPACRARAGTARRPRSARKNAPGADRSRPFCPLARISGGVPRGCPVRSALAAGDLPRPGQAGRGWRSQLMVTTGLIVRPAWLSSIASLIRSKG